MKTGAVRLSLLVVVALPLGCVQPRASADPPALDLASIALRSTDSERGQAIAALRALGPEGLKLVLAQVDAQPVVATMSKAGAVLSEEGEHAWEVVDLVAGQRDAHASRLFWHEDLEQAKAQALHEGKPILSLRLLGRLDEELSCANSRFFRTVLYPNGQVNAELRDRFVLHWESVRPVPKLTIDFGDGRTLETTITGNSIHYVLLPDGSPVDALPGLWGAAAFLDEIRRAADLSRELMAMPEAAREARLRAWHEERLRVLDGELRADADRLEPAERAKLLELIAQGDAAGGRFTPDVVFSVGTFYSFPDGTKITAELPVMRQLVPDVHGMRNELPDEVWAALARLHADECRLDEASRDIARRKELRRSLPGAATPSNGATERLEPLFERLQRSVAEDTVRNRFMTGARLHEWFASGSAPSDLPALNERVYRELFLSPVNDAWLGLSPPDAYTGLDGGGRKGSES